MASSYASGTSDPQSPAYILALTAAGWPECFFQGWFLVSTLRENRIKTVHGQFLKAADMFPHLSIVAVTPQFSAKTGTFTLPKWPIVEASGGQRLGLIQHQWQEFLPDGSGTLFRPIVTRWLHIYGFTWQAGVYFNRAKINELNSKDTFNHLMNEWSEFESLAKSAASALDIPMDHSGGLPQWITLNPVDRWLEWVCKHPSIKEIHHDSQMLTRTVTDEIFLASASTIEWLDTPANRERMSPAKAAYERWDEQKRSQDGNDGNDGERLILPDEADLRDLWHLLHKKDKNTSDREIARAHSKTRGERMLRTLITRKSRGTVSPW